MADYTDYEQLGEDEAEAYLNSLTPEELLALPKKVLNVLYNMTPAPEVSKVISDKDYSVKDAALDLQDKYVPFNSAWQNYINDQPQDWERNAMDALLMAYPAGKAITKGTKALNTAYEAANPGRNAKSGLVAHPNFDIWNKLTPEEQTKTMQAIRKINRERNNGLLAKPKHFEREDLANYKDQNLKNVKNTKLAAEYYAKQTKLNPDLAGVRTDAILLDDATDAAVVRHKLTNYNDASKAFNHQIRAWIDAGRLPGYSVKKQYIDDKGNFAYHIIRDSDGALVNTHDEFKALYNEYMENRFPGYTKASETPTKNRRF